MNLRKIKTSLIEQASEAFISRLLGLTLCLLLLLSGGSWGIGAAGGSWTGRGVGVGVSDTVLELIYLGPAVLSLDGNGQNLLIAVDNRVHNRWKGGEVGSQRDGSDGGDGARERLEKLGLLDVENAGRESVALVVHLGNTHTVSEGRDVQHVEQSSLGGSDLASSLDELEFGGDFNGTTGNLGWDTESLEERGLSGFHTSVTSWDEHIGGSDGTSSGGGGDLVGENLVTDRLEIGVGEDETDVALDERKETLVLWGVGDEALDGTTDLWNRQLVDAQVADPQNISPWCSCPSGQRPRHGGLV